MSDHQIENCRFEEAEVSRGISVAARLEVARRDRSRIYETLSLIERARENLDAASGAIAGVPGFEGVYSELFNELKRLEQLWVRVENRLRESAVARGEES